VDHSALGANGYLLRTSSATIAYTGDLRLHGKATDLTEKFIEAASNAEPDVLLCEGTRINETQSTTENDVLTKSMQTIRKAKGLVIADFAYRDMTRLKTFYDVATKTDRKLVITMKDAYLVHSLTESCELPFELPSIADENILIYQDRKGSGRYQEKDYRKWERPILERANIIRAAEVHERQKHLIIHLTFYDFNELIDIDPSPGATYIHSSSEPYNEEQVIDQERLNNWLHYFHMTKHQFHASGHANGDEIRKIVDRIKPRELIPIHTQHPELFEKIHDNVQMPVLQPFN
jgi:ribonuclease J